MKSIEGHLQVTGGKIWYRVFPSKKKKTPLIVLHGGPGSSSHSMLTLNKFSKDRTVVFYDQLGSGHSGRPSDKKLWKKERFVEELELLRQHLEFEEIYLWGHSWGTMLAAMYTIKYPKRVKSILFSGPFFNSKRWIEDANTLKRTLPQKIQDTINVNEQSKTYNSKDYEKATLEFYKKYFCRIYPYPKPIQEGHKLMGLDVYNTMWGPTEFHCTGNLKNADCIDQLHKINVPVLLICGKYDMATPLTTKFYAEKFPNAKMKVLNKSAHTMFLEEKEEFLKIGMDFFSDVDSQIS